MSEPLRASAPTQDPQPSGPRERFAGDEADFVWPDTRIGIGFEKLHEEKDGLKGEVAIVRGDRRDLVYFSTFNLTAGETRERLGRSLEKKTGIAEALWQEYLTYACWEATQKFREGTPRINLRTHKPRPVSYLIKGILPLGDTSVIYGDGSSTKSLNAMALAASAVTGKRIGGYEPVERAIACLYVDYETYEDEQANRFRRIMAGIGLDEDSMPDFYYFQTFRNLAQEGARLRREIDEIRREHKAPDGQVVVVVDSIAWAVGGEVVPEVVIPFFNTLRSLGSGVSRIVVSHVSKQDAAKQKGVASPYGSVFVRNAARSAHEFVSTDGPNGTRRIGIFHRKTNSSALTADLFIQVGFDDSADADGRKGPITFTIDDGAKTDMTMAMKSGSAKDRLLALLNRDPGTVEALANEAGISHNIARARLNDLQRAGLIESVPGKADGQGRPTTLWRIAPRDEPPDSSFEEDDNSPLPF